MFLYLAFWCIVVVDVDKPWLLISIGCPQDLDVFFIGFCSFSFIFMKRLPSGRMKILTDAALPCMHFWLPKIMDLKNAFSDISWRKWVTALKEINVFTVKVSFFTFRPRHMHFTSLELVVGSRKPLKRRKFKNRVFHEKCRFISAKHLYAIGRVVFVLQNTCFHVQHKNCWMQKPEFFHLGGVALRILYMWLKP